MFARIRRTSQSVAEESDTSIGGVRRRNESSDTSTSARQHRNHTPKRIENVGEEGVRGVVARQVQRVQMQHSPMPLPESIPTSSSQIASIALPTTTSTDRKHRRSPLARQAPRSSRREDEESEDESDEMTKHGFGRRRGKRLQAMKTVPLIAVIGTGEMAYFALSR